MSIGRQVRRLPSSLGGGFLRAGFTLIELMVVMGIVAIIVAAGVPSFVHAMRKEGLRKAVSDMVEACSHARAQAILRGVPTELVIRASDGLITVRSLAVGKPDDNAGGGLSSGTAAGAGPNFKSNLSDDVAVRSIDVNFEDQMKNSEARVRFFPNGTSDEFTITLTCATGERQISLDVITALAEVKVLR
jgi:type II secretion system protein H